jgi:predicted HAD superfamily phosphohydrolase YqeG
MQSFQNLNISGLKGYQIFLDIDGTLVDDNEVELSEATMQKIRELEANNRLYLCSNSRNHERNRKVAELSGVKYLDTDLRKPSKKILELVDESPFKERLVIGDKFLTDGLFAKNIGAEFTKVARIESGNDRLYIKFLYWIDDLASKIFRL